MKTVLCFLGLTLASFSATLAAELPTVWLLQADRIEFQDHEDAWLWDLQGWVGGDTRKLWWKTEGEFDGDHVAGAEMQLLYSKAISPFFDLQFGLRHDLEPDPTRTFAVVGIQGLAPQWFEIDTAAFLSDDGDLSARFEVEYDLFLSQRLILQPRLELQLGASGVAELGLGSGLRSTDLGFRLRYEFRRELAPYLGLSWRKSYGGTKDAIALTGGDNNFVTLVAGARFWF